MQHQAEVSTQRPHSFRSGGSFISGGRAMGRIRLLVLAAFVGLILLSGVFSGNASADNSPARKLGRGVANLGLGVMVIPSVVIEMSKESGPALGVTWGFLKGTAMMVVTESVGLWEIFTCPFATPPDYVPILSPEFPWQRFTADENQRRKRKVRTGTGGGRRVRE